MRHYLQLLWDKQILTDCGYQTYGHTTCGMFNHCLYIHVCEYVIDKSHVA